MTDEDCQHLSWECTSTNPYAQLSDGWHTCNDCDWQWDVNSRWASNNQIGKCSICQSDAEKSINPNTFVTKDSGERESFDTGAVRDTQDGKPRYDLIPPKGLKRVAEVYARGSVKYDDHNWRKGMPSSRFM